MATVKKKQTSELVPYSGADQTVDLGSQNLTTSGTITAGSFVGPGSGSGAVDSVNGATGVVVLDTDDVSEGATNKYFSTELAQDAVGAMVNATLVYTDGTPLLSRAAISGDITIASTSNTASITAGAIMNTHINASAAIALSKLDTGALPTGITIASANLVDGTIVNADINASAAIDATKIADGSVTNTEFQYISTLTSNAQTQLSGKVNLTGNETVAGVKTFSSIPVLPGSDPTTANQATRKSYVDAIGQMVDPSLYKNACTCATTANITLSGEQTIDTFATSATRVLVKDQTAPAENGIYISSSGAWTRASDYNTAGEVLQGTSTFILDGGVNKDRLFVMNEASVTTLGTDAIGFTPLSSLNSYNPGAGILISGSDISFDPDFITDAITTGLPSTYGVNITYGGGGLYAILDWATLNDSTGGIDPSTTLINVKNSADDVGTITINNFITESDIVSYSGTLVDDAIATFNGTTGLIQDSGIKIASGVIEPNTQAAVTLRSPTRTSTSTGFTTTISGGDSIQSGNGRLGGDLVLQGGAGYDFGASYVGGKFRLTAGSDWYGSAIYTGENISFCHPTTPSSRFLTFLTSDIPTGSLVVSFRGSGVLQGLSASSLSDIASVPLYFDQGTQFNLTATGNRTILAPTALQSGNTTYDGARIIIAHTASGADRTLALTTGSSGAFRFSSSVPSLTATASGTTDYITCVYNSTASRWDVVHISKGSQASPVSIETFPTDIQIFTSSGTWTKPGGTPKTTQIIAIGGGGGGGAGRKGAAGTVRCGGGGGGAGGWGSITFPTSILGSTETVTVGTGGAGAASQTTNTTNGAAGTDGGNTTFGSWFKVEKGQGGFGGTATSGLGGTGFGSGFPDVVGYTRCSGGGAASASGAAGGTGSQGRMVGSGGGAGGGITTGNIASLGGAGGAVSSGGAGYGTTLTGGAAGATSSNGGAGNASPTNSGVGGSGGGGGGSSITTNAGSGGNGALYGAGGGGGGAATNSVGNSGAGGAGADGFCIVITNY